MNTQTQTPVVVVGDTVRIKQRGRPQYCKVLSTNGNTAVLESLKNPAKQLTVPVAQLIKGDVQ